MTRTLPLSHALCLALALPLLACGDKDDGDDSGDEALDESNMPYCEDTVTGLGADDEALGVTGAGVLESVPAEGSAALQWADDGDDTLSFSIAADAGSLRFVESEAVYPSNGGASPAIAVECPDYWAVDATLGLTSGDGRLDESVAVTLVLDEHSPDALDWSVELDPDALGGTLDLTDFLDPSSYDTLSLGAWGQVSGGAIAGELSAQGTGGDEDVAWAENIPIATFGAGIE